MMADSTETKAGKSNGMMAQTKIFEIVSSRITNQKLNGNNYLQ